jgi:hypothetical protein
MKTHLFSSLLALLSGSLIASAASVRIEWENGAGTELLTLGGAPLTPGPEQFKSDGAILGLGYYTLGTPSSPFAGSWVPFTGPGTSVPDTTIGTKVVGVDQAGLFNLSISFSDSHSGIPFPAPGAPLAIRFYDSTSLETSTYFNAVSSAGGGWNWIDPTDPQTVISLTLTDPGLVWLDGPESAFRTTIPIPEPHTAFLAAAGFAALLGNRKRLRPPAQTTGS